MYTIYQFSFWGAKSIYHLLFSRPGIFINVPTLIQWLAEWLPILNLDAKGYFWNLRPFRHLISMMSRRKCIKTKMKQIQKHTTQKRQKYKNTKTKKEFNISTSWKFWTLAMFDHLIEEAKIRSEVVGADEKNILSWSRGHKKETVGGDKQGKSIFPQHLKYSNLVMRCYCHSLSVR